MGGHTKGPWRLMPRPTPGKWWVADRGPYHAILSDQPLTGGLDDEADLRVLGGYLIAESVRQPNADVLAAAPDLLAALSDLMEWREEIEDDLGVHTSKERVRVMLDQAEVAIAKARGES